MTPKYQIREKLDKWLTARRRYWISRALVLAVLVLLVIKAWPAFYMDHWVDATGPGDYLPMRLNQEDTFVQPLVLDQSGISAITLSFDPPVALQQPDYLLLDMEIRQQDTREVLFSQSLTAADISRYTSTKIPFSIRGYDPGLLLELHLKVSRLGADELLSIHTINVSDGGMLINGRDQGVAMAILFTYTQFDTVGLLVAAGLLILVLLLLFAPMGWLKRFWQRFPIVPVLLAPVLMLLITELMNTLNQDILLPTVLIVFSYLFLLLFQTLFMAALRHDRTAVFISSVLVGGFAVANHSKQFFRGDPLFAGDIMAVGMVLRGGVNQLQYIPNVRFLLSALIALIFILLFVHMRRESLIKTLKYRIGYSAGALLLIVLLAGQVVMNDTLMITQFNVSRYPWNQMMNYRQNGFIIPFVRSINDLIIRQPLMQHPIPEDFYLAPEQRNQPLPEHPNIIVIMSESYTDFNNINPINPSEPVMPFFDQLRESDKTISGNLLTPVFGGGTCNTEFEYLTGGSMIFFHDSSVPYMNYFRKPVHSMPDLLSQQGYRSVAIHPYLRSFWNRQTVYPAMGFDQFISLEDFPVTDEMPIFVSDHLDFAMIVEQLEEKEAEERLFVFSVTMQNHFPYYSTEENHSRMNYHIMLPEFAESDSVELYLNMLRESDDALRDLVTYLDSLDEPCLLVFFGDHLPGNNNCFNAFYAELFGKSIADLKIEEMLKLYETPYLIWANYELPEQEPVSLTSPNFLGIMTLDMAGVDRSPYFDAVDSVHETVKAVSTTMLIMQNGRIYDRDSIPQSLVRQLDRYWAYQYDNIIRPLEPQ